MTVKLEIPAAALPKGNYAHHVAQYGHVPGTLSGAELSTKARKNGWYAKQRRVVATVLRGFGVSPVLTLLEANHRLCVVWVDNASGEPVEIRLT